MMYKYLRMRLLSKLQNAKTKKATVISLSKKKNQVVLKLLNVPQNSKNVIMKIIMIPLSRLQQPQQQVFSPCSFAI